MNKRIRELAEQAGFTVREESISTPVSCWFGEWHDIEAYCDEEAKKFAELIVRECVFLMNEEKERYDNPGTYESDEYYIRMKAKAEAFENATSIIKYHFGVEE